MARLTQLRTYTINKGQMDEFVAVWREKVVPLRRAYGFEVDGGWVFTESNKFVWMMSMEGTPDEWAAQDKTYLTSPERVSMTPNPSDYLAHMDLQMLRSVLEE